MQGAVQKSREGGMRRSRRTARFTIGRRGGLQAARGTFLQPGTLRAKEKPHGGVKTPPYGMREQGCKPSPFVARPIPRPRLPKKSPSCGRAGQDARYTECPKGRGKICRKNRKKVLTKGSPGGIIVKLSGAGARGGKPENRIGTAWNGFRERKVPDKVQKISKKFLTNERT